MVNCPDVRSTALAFVERINVGDVDGITALMTEDHEFVDTAATSYRGREAMRAGWIGYFQLFPNYHIQIEQIRVADPVVTLLARTTGILSPHGQEALRGADGSLPPDEELQGPVVVTALIRDGQVAQWRVYADTP